ncbi:MAG: cell division protein [Rhodospirillaceae bacterium]|nr:MAG: cell division protein [Rhodospirillaceae bacterium]
MMLAFRSDLPLRKTAAGHFVQWLVMVLVFMAALAATVHAYTDGLLTHWNRSVVGTLTVQIPPPAAENATPAASTSDAVTAALGALKTHPAVATANLIPRGKVLELLEPWLGSGAAVSDLPLPALIDVQLRDNDASAAAAVGKALSAAVPTAIVDDHRVWLSRLTNLAEGVGVVALTLMAMISGALALTVIFATRASLAEFVQVIEVLHLVGAKDDYIAGQFARRALSQGIIGGLCGLMLYVPTLGVIAWLGSRVERGMLPDITLPLTLWLTLAALPFVAGLLAMATAHMTVRRTLRTMM